VVKSDCVGRGRTPGVTVTTGCTVWGTGMVFSMGGFWSMPKRERIQSNGALPRVVEAMSSATTATARAGLRRLARSSRAIRFVS
jgi:hypothetical protein